MQPRGLEVVMSSPASYPRAAGPAGQTAGRATCGVRALVAPGALLKPASEAESRGARPRRSEAPSGAPTSPERGERRPRHMRESRACMVGETRGSAQEGPGGRRAARTCNGGSRPADKDGGNGLASESRAGRCLANSMHATGVEASAPAAVRAPPRGLPGSCLRPGSPGAGLPYLSTCGLVLYGQGGARESRAWSHVCQAEPKRDGT